MRFVPRRRCHNPECDECWEVVDTLDGDGVVCDCTMNIARTISRLLNNEFGATKQAIDVPTDGKKAH